MLVSLRLGAERQSAMLLRQPRVPQKQLWTVAWKAAARLGVGLKIEGRIPPDVGPPGGWVQGPRRGRQYGPDGKPSLDIDKPHQGNEADHAHEWPDGVREEPRRPVSPWPKSK